MRPEDIELLAAPGAPAMRGDLLLVGVSTPDIGLNAYRGGLRRVPLDGASAHDFTHGFRDLAAAISPDGTKVAFLRVAEQGSKPQVYVMPVDGGDARAVTGLPLGAGAPVWAPDSRRIAFVARIPEPGRYGTEGPDGTVDAQSEAPRLITRLDFRQDDAGYVTDRCAQLFVVDTGEADAVPTALTEGFAEPGDPAWTPSGQHVLVSARRDWGAEGTTYNDLYAVPADGGAPVLVARSAGTLAHPVVTADGMVAYLGEAYDGSIAVANNAGLWAVPLRLDGVHGESRRLTDPETVDCDIAAGRPVVTSRGILVGVRNQGAVELRRVDIGAAEAVLSDLTLVAGSQGQVKGFAADDDRAVAVVSTWDSMGDVVLVSGDETNRLTDLSAPLRERGIRPLIEIKGSAPDGYGTHGWLVLPEGDGPHPVILSVHGGPFMYYGWGLFDEAQVYAEAGYAVVLPNPRGSAGYGQEHGRAIIGAMGTVDVDDVLSVLDAALERPDLDSTRVGIMGGSYGGWMTSWLAAHHGPRFKAAWSERAVNVWDSFVGASDIGWWFADSYCGPDPETQHDMSPLTHADKIDMPFLIAHSEQDYRCPVDQAQRMFVKLRRNGVPAEMLLFPGEGHELTRSGQPRHRKQRFDAVLDWWSRYL
ncbi:Acylamino-acid-releasing enzyme [Alloactinosynnema sp. L-07]|uniref:S9 family peptidase n=1 Tax=Alloactinosynnema sp. L-07 TaxID=1653480 RepID=UPI00065F0880|nr:S9 family peptidase [Alloactinosynnema sp. L-07]CRK56240.1 Acylamino-acid-releasing enzyme [Alloactinosynnema sp. L-07]